MATNSTAMCFLYIAVGACVSGCPSLYEYVLRGLTLRTREFITSLSIYDPSLYGSEHFIIPSFSNLAEVSSAKFLRHCQILPTVICCMTNVQTRDSPALRAAMPMMNAARGARAR